MNLAIALILIGLFNVAVPYHLPHIMLAKKENEKQSHFYSDEESALNLPKQQLVHDDRTSKKKAPPAESSESSSEIASNVADLGLSALLIKPHKIRNHRHKQRQALIEDERTDELLDDDRKPGMLVRVTKSAIDQLLSEGAKLLEDELRGQAIPEFSFKVLDQLDVTVNAIKIFALEFPEVRYEPLSRDTVLLKTCGGQLDLRGRYKSVFQTTREGHFGATVNGLDTYLRIKLVKSLDGKLKLQEKLCNASISQLQIDLNPSSLDDVIDGIQTQLRKLLKSQICDYINQYVEKIDGKLTDLLRVTSMQLELGKEEIQFDAKMMNDVVLGENFFDVELAGEFLRGATRTPFQPEPITKHETDIQKMFYLYISEYVLNSFFYQVDSYAFLRINLHRIPEIEDVLKLDCADTENCFGQNFQWDGLFEPNSGRMEARPNKCPSVSFTENGALLKLDLTIDVGYQRLGAKVRSVVLSFDLEAELLIESIHIEQRDKESPKYEIRPKVGIKVLKVKNVKDEIPEIKAFSNEIVTYVNDKKNAIEKMLNKNLYRILHMPTSLVSASNIGVHFRNKTFVLEFDLKMDSKIFHV